MRMGKKFKRVMPEHTPSPSPERAIYGFVLYLGAILTFGLYIVWAYIPEKYLHAIGLYYWPQKYWAVAAPTYFWVTIIFVIIFYSIYNLMLAAPLDSVHTLKDKYSKEIQKDLPEGAIPPLGDMDICEVNKILYGKG